MTKFSHLFKLILLVSIIAILTGCNGNGNSTITNNNSNNPSNPDNPESSSIGFISFTLQNFAPETSKSTVDNYAAKIVMDSESDSKSNIYFTPPQDALNNKMLDLTKLYPIITTDDTENIYIGTPNNFSQIMPNSSTNPAFDFTQNNLQLIITKPDQAIESGKVFTLHLEPVESANISLTKVELKLNPTGFDISNTLIDESTGVINSWITSDINLESIILYPNFYFARSTNENSLPIVLESNQAVNFTRISNIESRLITHYHITSNNGKNSAIYTNLLTTKPEDIHTGFATFTVQNFAPEATKSIMAKPYAAKIIISSESDNESNIYFTLPKDALSSKMLDLTSLYPIITTQDIESIYIGTPNNFSQILPNSSTNPVFDFTRDNLQLIITKPNQAIESGKVFNLHLEASDAANITLTQLELKSSTPPHLTIASSSIESTTGIISSLINFGQDLNNDLTLYPIFHFNKTADDSSATANESGLPVTFKTIPGTPSTLIAQYHVVSKNGNVSAIYANLLTHAQSSQARILGFSVDNPDALEFDLDEANKGLKIITTFTSGDITGPLHLAYFGKSITIDDIPFQDGQVVIFLENIPHPIEITPYSGATETYHIFSSRQDGPQ